MSSPLEIIDNIPVFVWPLFCILLVGGLKARKTSMVPLALLLGLPTLFFSWSTYTFFGNFGNELTPVLLWSLCLISGFSVGFTHMQRLNLLFDKQKRSVQLPGSWIPLILSMSIFSSKLSTGILSSTFPHLQGSVLLLSLELFATIILGVFAGRGIGCLFKYRQTSDVLA